MSVSKGSKVKCVSVTEEKFQRCASHTEQGRLHRSRSMDEPVSPYAIGSSAGQHKRSVGIWFSFLNSCHNIQINELANI